MKRSISFALCICASRLLQLATWVHPKPPMIYLYSVSQRFREHFPEAETSGDGA